MFRLLISALVLLSASAGGRTVERRAVEAMNWGMPAVNTDLMLQEMLNKTAGKVNQVVYWSRPLDWHNQLLTPNPDSIYIHGVLQHQGCWTSRAGYSGCRG